jgi:hypothetical protein
MLAPRTQRRTTRLGYGRGWRGLLAYALIALMVYAPIARAACELEHLASFAQESARASHEASPPASASDQSPDDQDTCCDDGSHAVMAESRTGVTAGAVVAPTGFYPLSPAAIRLIPVGRRTGLVHESHRPPPPESVFRRVPKLLI